LGYEEYYKNRASVGNWANSKTAKPIGNSKVATYLFTYVFSFFVFFSLFSVILSTWVKNKPVFHWLTHFGNNTAVCLTIKPKNKQRNRQRSEVTNSVAAVSAKNKGPPSSNKS